MISFFLCQLYAESNFPLFQNISQIAVLTSCIVAAQILALQEGNYTNNGTFDDGILFTRSFYTQNARFPESTAQNKLLLKNLCHLRKSNVKGQVNFLMDLQKKSTRLLQQIEKEYQIK